MMTPSPACIALVQEFEGCARQQPDGSFAAYPDPGTGGAPWTIGWGTTGPDVTPGTIWTQAQCDARLDQDVTAFAQQVTTTLGGAATSQNQFDALVDFAYNLGIRNLQTSTLLKLHKAGNYPAAAAEFPKWNMAAGKVLPGLVRRRAAEQALYSKP
ncbi:lysozyme [Sphingomonas sp. KR3-1]|uniref:lysozyme n=1 Tax=Sphingomonas sp. KR3-1 TaxID=3156611 RepID=UPI0032B3EEEC